MKLKTDQDEPNDESKNGKSRSQTQMDHQGRLKTTSASLLDPQVCFQDGQHVHGSMSAGHEEHDQEWNEWQL
eukprot:Skav231146  [mRNA]  locus=scaffold4611:31068:31283:- [translate_table: standard]